METVPFLEDIYPPNLLYAVTIRSPIAKGNIKFAQFPKLPEHYTLITARNIPGENRLLETNMPVLADSKLSYIGEPVALLAGPDKIKLEYLAAQCIVITDEEEPAFDCGKSNGAENGSRLLSREINAGNPDKEFEKDLHIVTSSYSTGIQDHWYAEPAGAIAWYKEQGTENKEQKKKKTNKEKDIKRVKSRLLTIKTATQWPYHVKHSVARFLGIDPSQVNVEQTELSLHMDGKLWYPSLIACHAALCAAVTNKPARLILNREEDFYFSPKRAASNINIISTIDSSGKITATKADISVNLGSYEVNGDEILDQITVGTGGLYKIDNLKLSAKAHFTNLPPQGPFSGFGISQGLFALERHVSLVADMAGVDPAIWRLENLSQEAAAPGDENPLAFNSSPFPKALLEKVCAASDYYRKWTAYELLRQSHKGSLPEKGESPRGIGIALGFQGNGLMHDASFLYSLPSVEAVLTRENKLEIKTSIASSEDYSRIWEKIAQDIISLEPGAVKIIPFAEGAAIPDSGPSCSSRNITQITKLVEQCCKQIKKQKFISPLPISARRSLKRGASCFAKPGYACCVVEVSVDLIECAPKIRGVWLGVDGGKIISQNRARRALVRGASQALGWAFTENIEYINGALAKNQFDNFSIPSPAEIPPIHIEFFNGYKSEPKGIGELPFTCIPAAFLQAVTQAMDHAFKNLPLKRRDIWEMVRLRGREC